MSFDGLTLAAVRAELETGLVGGWIDKVYQPRPYEVRLRVHHRGTDLHLLISVHAIHYRLHATGATRENPPVPPPFCLFLRRHLEGRRITGLEQPPLERILRILVGGGKGTPNRDHGDMVLCAELMGKHSNLILTSPAGTVMDSLKRIGPGLSRYRQVVPGLPYVPPPAPGGFNPALGTEAELAAALDRALEDVRPGEEVWRFLLRLLAGIGPVMARELAVRAGLDPGLPATALKPGETAGLREAILWLRDVAVHSRFQPTLVEKDRRAVAFAPVDLVQYPQPSRKHLPAMGRILDLYYEPVEHEEEFRSMSRSLRRAVQTHHERCRRKAALQVEALAEARHAPRYRLWGELLTANLYRLSAPAAEVRVTNYHHPDQPEVTIPLRPDLSPAENAARYFRRYRKARQAGAVARARLEETNREAAYLEQVLVNIEQARSLAELEEIRSELVGEGYLKESPGDTRQPKRAAQRQAGTEPSEPGRFWSSAGQDILVGHNNRQNDHLTMRIAAPEDLWFHARQIPGSHVILRARPGEDVPESAILEAATLAAYFSKARQARKVAVDYTQRRHVRKPRGARPGMVLYDHHTTVTVEPSPSVVERLRRPPQQPGR